MANAYWISFYREIKDPDKLMVYAQLAGPALEAAGGKFLARAIAEHVFDDGLKERVAVIMFDSLEAALAAHESAAYKKALDALGDGVIRDLRIVPGT